MIIDRLMMVFSVLFCGVLLSGIAYLVSGAVARLIVLRLSYLLTTLRSPEYNV